MKNDMKNDMIDYLIARFDWLPPNLDLSSADPEDILGLAIAAAEWMAYRNADGAPLWLLEDAERNLNAIGAMFGAPNLADLCFANI